MSDSERSGAVSDSERSGAVSDSERSGTVMDEPRDSPPQAPLLRVVNADATPEEVAALVAVFAALGSGGEAPPRRRTPEWSAPHRGVRRPHLSGPGGWRPSGLAR